MRVAPACVAFFAATLARAEPPGRDLSLAEIDAHASIPAKWSLKQRLPGRHRARDYVTYTLANDAPGAALATIDVSVARWSCPVAPDRFLLMLRTVMDDSIADLSRHFDFQDVYIVERGTTKVSGLAAYYVIAEATPAQCPELRVRVVTFAALDQTRMLTAVLLTADAGWDSAWADYKRLMNSICIPPAP